MTPELFSELVTNMQMRLLSCCVEKQVGFMILNDKGEQIGIWYSMLAGSIAVKMKDDNKVVIYPPRDDVYMKYEDKTNGRKW